MYPANGLPTPEDSPEKVEKLVKSEPAISTAAAASLSSLSEECIAIVHKEINVKEEHRLPPSVSHSLTSTASSDSSGTTSKTKVKKRAGRKPKV